MVVSLAARGGVSAGVLEALSRRLAASEMYTPSALKAGVRVLSSLLRRDRRANITLVDILTQRFENEQESCKRQSEVISDLRHELIAYHDVQVCLMLLIPTLHLPSVLPPHVCTAAQSCSSAGPCIRVCEEVSVAHVVDVRFGLRVSFFSRLISLCTSLELFAQLFVIGTKRELVVSASARCRKRWHPL